MLFAYIDESGDTGYSENSSDYYILSALVVSQTQWRNFHSSSITFINSCINKYNKRPNKPSEIHFKEFKNGQKGWYKSYIKNYYNDLANFLVEQNVQLFSVLIDKGKIKYPGSNPILLTSIKYLMERLAGFSYYKSEEILIIVDNSSTELHSKWRTSIRELKKSGTDKNRAIKFASTLIEEALFVDSKSSPEIQIVDSIAGFTLEWYKRLRLGDKNPFYDFEVKFPFYKGKGWGLKIWPNSI